ncbi:MAG TPA: hypothetical protein VGF13_12305 [Verrucomicrobiae bacterium]|jgi:hypothetical protein
MKRPRLCFARGNVVLVARAAIGERGLKLLHRVRLHRINERLESVELRVSSALSLFLSIIAISSRPHPGNDVGGNLAGAIHNFGWV